MNISGWSEEMMKSWTDAQQKYWSNLVSVGARKTETPNWAEGMEKWWALAMPQVPIQANEVMERVFEMGKVYTRLAENALSVASGSEQHRVLEDWMVSMEKGFKNWSEQGEVDFSDFSFGHGNQMIEGWQRVMDSLGMGAFKNLSEMENSLPGSAMWQEQLHKVLEASGVSRHIPQYNQKTLEGLSAAYQQAMNNYMVAFSGQGLESVQVLRERITQLGSEGGNISSLRELYDLWVDVSEEVYQKFAFSDEYQKIYGEMVNTFTALKGALDNVRDSQLQALRILTTSDLDSLLKKQQEVSRENADLKNELSQLKEQVAAMEIGEAVSEVPASDTLAQEAETRATEPVEDVNVQQTAEVVKPKPQTEDNKPDDLTRIRGLGPKMQEKLLDAGIQTFEHLAALSDDQARALDKQLDARGRLVRDNWVSQAGELSANQLA